MTPDPYILTFTGRVVNIWDPDPSTLVREDLAHHLARTGRFAGAGDRFLSVAQHCVHVSRLCPPERARWALIHDGEEAFLNDWPSPVKVIMRRLGGIDFEAWMLRWKHALSAAFDTPIEDVKEWDLQSMLAERRDNGPRGMSDKDWLAAGDYDDCPRPHPESVVPWSSKMAEAMYLRRWEMIFR